MNLAGYQLFADAALAEDEHGRVPPCELVDEFEGVVELLARADEARVWFGRMRGAEARDQQEQLADAMRRRQRRAA